MVSSKLLILGGTGATGLVVVEKALQQGYDVTVYARSTSKFPAVITSKPNLKVIEGTLTDSSVLSTAISGQDVIVSLLGPSSITGPGDIFPKAYSLILRLMKEHSVRRIYALGTFSIHDPADQPSVWRWLLESFVWLFMNHGWREFTGIGKVFDEEAGDLDWTVFRVGWLLNGDSSGTTTGYVNDENLGFSIRRSEIADWLLEEVKKDHSEWVGKKPGISSGGKPKSG